MYWADSRVRRCNGQSLDICLNCVRCSMSPAFLPLKWRLFAGSQWNTALGRTADAQKRVPTTKSLHLRAFSLPCDPTVPRYYFIYTRYTALNPERHFASGRMVFSILPEVGLSSGSVTA